MQIDTDTAKVTLYGAQQTTGDLNVEGGDILATDGTNAVNLFATTTAKVVCSPACPTSSILSSLNHPSQPLDSRFLPFSSPRLLLSPFFRPVPSLLLFNQYHRSRQASPNSPPHSTPNILDPIKCVRSLVEPRHVTPLPVYLYFTPV
jgi:hypothetical protein